MKDVMLDFETLGTKKNCVLLSVGLIEFDVLTGATGKEEYFVFDPESQLLAGRSIDQSTVDWWEKQSEEAKQVLTDSRNPNLVVEWNAALARIAVFFKDIRGATLWSNGANFDVAILEDAYANAGLKLPRTFWKTRCVRTVHDICKELTGAAYKKIVDQPTVAHNALEDCKYQIAYTVKAYQTMHKAVRIASERS